MYTKITHIKDHGNKGWEFTCKWIKRGSQAVRDIFNQVFRGFMEEDHDWLAFKYYYIGVKYDVSKDKK